MPKEWDATNCPLVAAVWIPYSLGSNNLICRQSVNAATWKPDCLWRRCNKRYLVISDDAKAISGNLFLGSSFRASACNWVVVPNVVSSIADKACYDILMTVKYINGTRIITGFNHFHSIVLDVHDKVINQMGVIKGGHKEWVSLANAIAIFYYFLHRLCVFNDSGGHLLVVGPTMSFDFIVRLFHRSLDAGLVVYQVLNCGHVIPVATITATSTH